MIDPKFLTYDDIVFIHGKEIERAGGDAHIRDIEGIKSCVESPKSTFGGEYLNDIYEMAASYIVCLAIRHPFTDGNKRVALASALTFLFLNGFEIEEKYEQDLADMVLNFLVNSGKKSQVAEHLSERATQIR